MIVSRVTLPVETIVGVNDLLIVRAAATLSVAVAAVTLLPWLVWSPFTAIVFVRLPVGAVGPTWTGTVIVHVPLAGIVPPVMAIEVAPGAAVSVPPQVVIAAGAAAMVNPAPIVVRLSVKLVMLAGTAVVFCRVMVSVVTLVC